VLSGLTESEGSILILVQCSLFIARIGGWLTVFQLSHWVLVLVNSECEVSV